MANLLNNIKKVSICSLVFLLPLFWLPFSFEALEFNKQYVLFFLAFLSLFFWLAKMVFVDKEIRFKRTPLDIPILAFLFVAILSTIFSIDKYSSLLGFYGRFSDGLIGLLGLGALYFLITNNVQTEGDKQKLSISCLLNLFLWSSFFAILFSYLSIFGIWSKLANFQLKLPLVMLQRTFNPVSSSMEGLAMFLSILTVLVVSQICFLKLNFKQWGYWVLLVAALGLLIIVDFTPAWIVLILTLTLFLIFAISTRMFREDINKLLLPIFLIFIAIFFLSTNTIKTVFPLPQEPILNQSQSWSVGLKTVISGVKAGVLGSGVGTFYYDFLKFKSPALNQTNLWAMRFDRAGNYFAEILGNMGFLGFLSYLVLIGMFLLIFYFYFLVQVKALKSEIRNSRFEANSKFKIQNSKQVPLLMTFLALLIGQFVYYQNTVLAFTFWLFLGLSAVSWRSPISEKTISFKDYPELSLVFSVFLIILGVVIFGFYFFAGRFYLADINFINALGTPDQSTQITNLEKAVKLNPYQTQYKLFLARAYLNQALSEMTKPLNEQDPIKIQNGIAKAIEQARIATEISPNNEAVWEMRGAIYRDIRQVAAGATDWGIRSFEKAIELEPANPALHVELGKLLLDNKPDEAKKKFEKAVELKSDYVEAIFYLGWFYYINNQTDEAISQFQKAIQIFPYHSNSLYALGLAFEKKGQKEEALKMFERVLELNPDNQDVIAKIEELKK